MSGGAPTIESVSAGVTAPAGEAVSVTQGGACDWAAIVQERLLGNVAPLAEEVALGRGSEAGPTSEAASASEAAPPG